MATINPTTTTAQTTPTKTAGDSAVTGFAQNFDSFLMLLTTQLKNQDPLSPLSATEFTTQLVQFAGVEQNIRQSKSLDELVAMQKSFQTTNAVGYIGKSVDVGGSNVLLQNGASKFSYTLAGAATETTITIKDSSGNIVRTLPGNTLQGVHTLNWDGKDKNNNTLADGVYTFSVAAKNGNVAVSTTTGFSGVVSAVDTSGSQVLLVVNNNKVPLSDVQAVRQAPSS